MLFCILLSIFAQNTRNISSIKKEILFICYFKLIVLNETGASGLIRLMCCCSGYSFLNIKRKCQLSPCLVVNILMNGEIKFDIYHPPTKLREGKVFTRVCQSFCSRGWMGTHSLPLLVGTTRIYRPGILQDTDDKGAVRILLECCPVVLLFKWT